MADVLEEYLSPELVGMWTDYVDWGKRREGERGFLERVLRERGCTRVLDAAAADGCDAIHLSKLGFSVFANEKSAEFSKILRANCGREKIALGFYSFDWREFGEKFDENSFDAIVLSGNSLCCLFDAEDRLNVLRGFLKILRKGGVLIIDERNSHPILSDKIAALEGKRRASGKFVYCGSRVRTQPFEISGEKIAVEMRHENGACANFSYYPFKRGELLSELKQAGFGAINRFSDFARGFNENAEFYQYVAVK